MKIGIWSGLTLITILLSPIACIFVRDLDDGPVGTKPSTVDDKLLDDIDDQLDSDLIPPNFQPDPLLPLPVGGEDNFEDVGQLNKGRVGDDPDDPFNLYMSNVFDSLPEASSIFDALRLNKPSDSPKRNLSPVPPELLIPLLMDDRLSADDEDQESRNGEIQEATLKMAKFIVDSKHGTNKSDTKSTSKDQDRKLVGKLSPLKSSSTSLTSKGSTIKTTTDKPNESKEEMVDEKVDQVHGDEEGEEKSKKSTTKSSKSRHFDNSLLRWLTKSKSTTPKVQGKTTTDSDKVTTEGPRSLDVDDEDDDLTSSNSTSTVTPSTKSSKSGSSTTVAPSTTSTTGRGRGKSSSTTTSSTTNHSTGSDAVELVTTSKGKHSNATSTSKPSKTSKKEEDGDSDKAEPTKHQIDTSLSSLNIDPSSEKVTSTTSTTNSSTTKSEAKHSHKHDKTTPVPTSTTSIDADRSTTTNEPETKTKTKSTTSQSKDDDIFPTESVTKSKTKSGATTTSTPRSLLTIQGHKTTRHSSTAQSTTIPTLQPYSEDSDGLFLPSWDPDIFP